MNLKKIASCNDPVLMCTYYDYRNQAITIDNCTFGKCNSNEGTRKAHSGALYVENEQADFSFSIRDSGETLFSSCECSKGKSGGIYLKIGSIADAAQIKWPSGANLIFERCTAGTEESRRNTGLYVEVPTGLHKEMAKVMKYSFAENYSLPDYAWFVAGKDADGSDIDFISMYLDTVTMIYVKAGGDGDGKTFDSPMSSLRKA
ncbi:uncharacterized protein MONOS_14907 [Monocercomonoides exilis]|uniref:uncharacterized protein n=1 Tax=Monocercomonoides exilis TaxID=2049356 RepID=UPI00355A950C|nr:hypothetical protein MONOS_14907 [Monocercomonoides exilis]|eukprot:MONOS_14907.1-p1 / transcript=MONOS_14907.1 / gene=MONOS_14907 / organism=Monocercomonoides_exilis_PA203 / gene_product=unspecified product / transcript_product=unspecified product / location=Mono_scaffold01103:4633-5241(-) / protein_length=203 / sequence_SO=supercontig / SO=protein_coding / is_pseudo=false